MRLLFNIRLLFAFLAWQPFIAISPCKAEYLTCHRENDLIAAQEATGWHFNHIIKLTCGNNCSSPRLEFRDSMEANAFVTDTGGIILTSGLLNELRSSAEEFFVLAHEIGHLQRGIDVNLRGLKGSSPQPQKELAEEIFADNYAIQLMLKANIKPQTAPDLLKHLNTLSATSNLSPRIAAMVKLF